MNFKKSVIVVSLLAACVIFISCNKSSDSKSASTPPAKNTAPKVDVSTLKDPGKTFEEACKDGTLEGVQYYIETSKGSVMQPFPYAKTPLHWVAASKHPETVRYLLDKGAIANQTDDDQFTPLHTCAMWGDSVSCKMLVKAGAVLYAQDNNRMTPLHLAAMKANKETTLALVESGANITAENENKWTPLRVADYAKKTALESKGDTVAINKEVAKIDDYMNFLRQHGATK